MNFDVRRTGLFLAEYRFIALVQRISNCSKIENSLIKYRTFSYGPMDHSASMNFNMFQNA